MPASPARLPRSAQRDLLSDLKQVRGQRQSIKGGGRKQCAQARTRALSVRAT